MSFTDREVDMAKWINKDNFRPEIVLHKLDSIKKVDNNGKISFSGFEAIDYIAIIATMVKLASDVPTAYTPDFVRGAVFDAAAAGKLTTDTFLKALSFRERKYLDLPIKRFTVLTSLSLAYSNTLTRLTWDGLSFSFYRCYPNRFARSREGLFSKSPFTFAQTPDNYTKVAFRVSARDPGDAIHIGIDYLDTIRGVMNYLNGGRGIMLDGRKGKPFNDIRLGPTHTVHDFKGVAATDIIWYDPYYQEWGAFNPPTRIRENLIASIRTVRKYIKSKVFSSTLEEVFRRHARAFDHSDLSVSMTKAWSLLEMLTDTGRESYDTTVSRAAFLYSPENEIHEQLLQHLRESRNQIIHIGTEYDDYHSQLNVLQTKRYIDTLIGYFCDPLSPRRLSEIIKLLSLPNSETSIAQSIADCKDKLSSLKLAKKIVGDNARSIH